MSNTLSLRDADVVIAGAGPVGLFLACELALAHVDVLVLEREPSPHAPLKAGPLGLRGLSVATAEALDRRGLLAPLLARFAQDAPSLSFINRADRPPMGHFSGIPLDPMRIDLSQWPYRLPSPAFPNLATDMQSIETVLAERAQALGVQIRRGVEVTGLVQDAEGVTLHTRDRTMRAAWLVGCDGGRSRVRKLAGFEFDGTEPSFTAYTALVEIAQPSPLLPGRQITPAGFYLNEPGRIAMADFDGGAFDRSQPLTREHLQAVLRRISGTDLTLATVRQATTFTDRARLATTYRQGRVLLAGDAAHIHSALGGQGLNTGLGDAMNLGWKLAATVHGTAPADLLDSYHAERHPVGQWVLDWTRAQAALLQPGPQARALESIVKDLVATRDGTTHLAGQLWGLSLRYDLGGTHPLIGCSAPDFTFDDGTRLAFHLQAGQGLLLDLDPAQPLRPVAAPWRDRIRYLPATPRETLGLTGLLIRPDGVVAWASDGRPEGGEIEAAGMRWFGSAA